MTVLLVQLADAAATEQLGAALAEFLPDAGLVTLEGPLGAGKTTLCRGLLRALGFSGRVRSPSYSLLESYELDGRRVLHLDLYRIKDPAELDYLGLREQFDSRTLLLVEWPQHGDDQLPPALLKIELDYQESQRSARLISGTLGLAQLLAGLPSSIRTEQCQLTDGLHDENACQ